MPSIDVARIRTRARVAYELGRLRRALLGMAPVVVIAAAAMCFTHRPVSALAFGVATFVLGILMLWYGRDPQRAVLPGVAAGIVPLFLALCANQLHVCGPHGCTNLCVPACTVGGVVAGLAVASVGNRRKAGPWFWLSASGLAILTGAMGCSCVGYSGILGLAVGFGAAMIPGLARRALAKRA